MGVKPPAGDDDESELVEFGIAAVDAKLRGSSLSFPATRADVADALGDVRVPYDTAGNDVPLGELLAELEEAHFETRQDLLNALHPQFEAYRANHGGGVVGKVRSVLPF